MKKLLMPILASLVAFEMSVQGDIIQKIGEYGGWGTVAWQPLSATNEPDDAKGEELDFVGDATNPGGYWAADANYVYFRMRVDIGTAPTGTFADSHIVLIDAVGYSADDGRPDYGFAWDSKSADNSKHGLEMTIRDNTSGTTWNTTKMDDLDGTASTKGTVDINGLISGTTYRTTDGYIQTVDSQSTSAFGTTTFIDFAVSKSYLKTYVPNLSNNTQWKIQFASISNATDHNNFSGDIAGGATLSSAVATGWSGPINIPEPASVTFIVWSGIAMLVGRRFIHR